jgi:hypothetical protein
LPTCEVHLGQHTEFDGKLGAQAGRPYRHGRAGVVMVVDHVVVGSALLPYCACVRPLALVISSCFLAISKKSNNVSDDSTHAWGADHRTATIFIVKLLANHHVICDCHKSLWFYRFDSFSFKMLAFSPPHLHSIPGPHQSLSSITTLQRNNYLPPLSDPHGT